MIQPGRKYDAGSGYRYGFNGKENDNEVKGEGNQQDYGMRIYDPRLGRFLSVDPITKQYPGLTPYQFASNTPIQAIDLDGLESVTVTGSVRVTYLFFSVAFSGTVAVDKEGASFYLAPELGLGTGVSIAAGVSVAYYPSAKNTSFSGWGMNIGGSIMGNGGDFSGSLQQDDKTGNPTDVYLGGGGGIPKIGGGAGAEVHASISYSFKVGSVTWKEIEEILPAMAEKLHISVEKLRGMIDLAKKKYEQATAPPPKKPAPVSVPKPKEVQKPKPKPTIKKPKAIPVKAPDKKKEEKKDTKTEETVPTPKKAF